MGIGRILVVEDDESLRRVTQAQLEKCGYETAVASDVSEALEISKASLAISSSPISTSRAPPAWNFSSRSGSTTRKQP